MSAPVYLPYCGSPPVPAEWLGNWNFDPVLLLGLGAVAASYAIGASRTAIPRSRQAAFYAGWGLVALALVSPLCNLTVALFSARVAQHMLIALVAAPLIVLGRAETACASLLPRAWRGTATYKWHASFAFSAACAIAFAAALWLWHAPYFYDLTLQSHAAYWTMHLSFIAAALLLWRALLARLAEESLGALAIALFSMVHMGLLGALLTFAPSSWYLSHRLTTAPWGLTALEDQQLGGLIMWVPGGAAFLLAALIITARLLRALEERQPA
jgi:putative membrane protein